MEKINSNKRLLKTAIIKEELSIKKEDELQEGLKEGKGDSIN